MFGRNFIPLGILVEKEYFFKANGGTWKFSRGSTVLMRGKRSKSKLYMLTSDGFISHKIDGTKAGHQRG